MIPYQKVFGQKCFRIQNLYILYTPIIPSSLVEALHYKTHYISAAKMSNQWVDKRINNAYQQSLSKLEKKFSFQTFFFFFDFWLADTGVWFYNGVWFKITKFMH